MKLFKRTLILGELSTFVSASVLVGTLAMLASCGGGGGGGAGVVGSATKDLVVSSDMVVPGQLLARNLIINDGVKITSPGNLNITTTGLVTLNGKISPAGGLTVIAPGGLNVGANGQIAGGNGTVSIADSQANVLTDAQADLLLTGGISVSSGGASKSATRAGLPTFHIPPITLGPGSVRRDVRVIVNGDLVGGSPGAAPLVVTAGPGADGIAPKNQGASCIATGGNATKGGSVVVRAAGTLSLAGAVFNLGAGGNGAAASMAGNCDVASATGGNGGDTGSIYMYGGVSIQVVSGITIHFGNGGSGGAAIVSGPARSSGCVMSGSKTIIDASSSLTATGGIGGKGSLAGFAAGAIGSIENVTVIGGTGGAGGEATSTGGSGGNDTCCPGKQGGKGGNAIAMGGKGGDSVPQLPSGIVSGGGFVGGAGGDSEANGGDGGNGSPCCVNPKPGGNGGNGGLATANSGVGGAGDAVGINGVESGESGTAGNGGNGAGPGNGGKHGTASPVPPLTAGLDGSNGGGCASTGCTDAIKPNNNIAGATQLQSSLCAQDTLIGSTDQSYFFTTLAKGNYALLLNSLANGQTLYVYNASGQVIGTATNENATLPVTVGATGTVTFGVSGAAGAFKFSIIAN